VLPVTGSRLGNCLGGTRIGCGQLLFEPRGTPDLPESVSNSHANAAKASDAEGVKVSHDE
jgi:hypothetical protein